MEPIATPIIETDRRIIPVDAGHMFYDKCIVYATQQQPLFIKGFNETLFTDLSAAESTKKLLIQEASAYQALQTVSYEFLPDAVAYDEQAQILYMSAHLPEDGWEWNLPTDESQQQTYIRDVLRALHALETVPSNVLTHTERLPSLDEIYHEGWKLLTDTAVRQTVLTRLEAFQPHFHDHVQTGVDRLRNFLESPIMDDAHRLVQQHLQQPRPIVAHFDARQSNITWHPDFGAKLVDWSWASAAPYGTDRTMFLIDIFKTGYDVEPFVRNHLEPGHALLQMGHWLVRGARPSAPGDNDVRFHQMASAVSAATLIL